MRTVPSPIRLAAFVVLASGCGVTDPNVEPCGDDCPGAGGAAGTSTSGVTGGGAGGGDSGRGGTGPAGGTSGGAAKDGGVDAGSGGTGGTDAGEAGTSGDAGGAGGSSGNDAGACSSCPAQKPHCASGECVTCVEDQHCPDGVCISHACRQCRTRSDCTDAAASRCTGDGECVPCSNSGDCDHLANTRACSAGTCVECTGTSYAACGTDGSGARRVCDSVSKACSTQLEQSAGLCEPCVSDAQCKPGQLCVMQTYDDPSDTPDGGELEVGYFCVWRQDSTETSAPSGSCANTRPFFATESATSIDGAQATICGLAVTTCAAYRHFRSQVCTGPTNDAACGDDRYATDGYCREVGAGSGIYRCTTPCLSGDDCDVGASCSDSPPKYCNLQ